MSSSPHKSDPNLQFRSASKLEEQRISISEASSEVAAALALKEESRQKGRDSLRTKIFVACGLLVVLCLLSSAIGWVGQRTLLNNFARYEETERLSFEILEIERAIPELKASVDNFLLTGAESQRRAANQTLGELLTRIQNNQDAITDPELKTLLDVMTGHLVTFDSQFDEAAVERAVRTELVAETIPESADRVLASITKAAALGSSDEVQAVDGTQTGINSRQEVRRMFTSAYAHLLQYFVNPRYPEFETALSEIASARRLIATVGNDLVAGGEASGADISETNQWGELASKIDEFERLALRSFQATRSYLFYSNVVLAGEISEFVYYANRIQTYVKKQQSESRQARDAAAARTETLTIAASVLAVVLATLLAVGLTYLIIPPLVELTTTFRRLSEGGTIDDIPAAMRSDEIGRMARAAQVFSARNRETRELLDYSRSLSTTLQMKAKALEASNNELDDFAYVASHDLKSPLRGIDNLAEWVEEDCKELIPEESRTHLSQMRERVQKMTSLLDDLLDYSRVGRVGHVAEEVDVHELVDSIIDILNLSSGLTVSIRGALPTLNTVRTPLQQVFLNLLTNSVKYNDKGSDGEISVACEELDDYFRFIVSDNGIGISPQHHERVFQMYQRVAVSQADGTGMGLALVRKSVEKYGGTITLESEENRGATFYFTWLKCLPNIVEQ